MNGRCLSIVFCLLAAAICGQTACNQVLGIPEPFIDEGTPIDSRVPEPDGDLIIIADQISQIYDTDLASFVSSSGLSNPASATVVQSDGVELLVPSVEKLDQGAVFSPPCTTVN